MNELQIFKSKQFGVIRTLLKDGEPVFVAVDVCKALEVQNHKDAIKRLDDDEKMGVVLTDPHGRPQKTNCVTESGLYSLVLGSRKPEAKTFKRWVTHDVIPAIRKTGTYSAPRSAMEYLKLQSQALFELNDRVDILEDKVSGPRYRKGNDVRAGLLRGGPHQLERDALPV